MDDYHVIISDPETTFWRLKPERKHLLCVCVCESRTAMHCQQEVCTDKNFIGAQKKKTPVTISQLFGNTI